ncbi:MAG: MlaC/ttg2D family ABC transporter substrate-binding protein [Planktomarina sp.]
MFTRRHFLATTLAVAATPAFALSTGGAQSFVQTVVGQIMGIVNSAGSKSAAARSFERILSQSADMPVIARSVLGPVARSTSNADLAAFSTALQGYLSRKYGAQFQDFKGGAITVGRARDRGRFVEVSSQAKVPGKSTVDVTFRVWDRSGTPKFIDLLVEGISLVTTERTEIGALLDQRGGSVSRLARDLRNLG